MKKAGYPLFSLVALANTVGQCRNCEIGVEI